MATIHATAVARHGHGLLLLGESGSGKSDLALRLLDRGWGLIADDQVSLESNAGPLWAHCPPQLPDQLEVRGLGIMRISSHPSAPLALAITLTHPERLPAPATLLLEGVSLPHFRLSAREASAPQKVEQALALVTGALG